MEPNYGFLLDENLPPAAGSILAKFGFPFTSVGDRGAPRKRSSDEKIVAWCSENNHVWVSLDRGARKIDAIHKSIMAGKTSIMFLPDKGWTSRDHLRYLVCRFDAYTKKYDAQPFTGRVRSHHGAPQRVSYRKRRRQIED